MKNIIRLITFGFSSATLLFIVGCTGGGGSSYTIANNGYYYGVNSSTCPRNRIDNKQILHCWNNKGQYLGSVKPIHPNVINEHRYQQQVRQHKSDNMDKWLNQTLNRMEYSNRTSAIRGLYY